jgi:hypothetical protein
MASTGSSHGKGSGANHMTNMVRVTDETYIALRGESFKYQAQLGRQVSMGQIISAALTVAGNHPEEISNALTGESND